MRNALIAVFAAVVGLGFAVGDAEARRLGGSKSFGMQRSAPAPASPVHEASGRRTRSARGER